ncbi:baseplate multidomain protein megatron [Szabonella alba]|uniref:Glycoside hydrolase/phage tail family protein n=1 Tax=Szabonella alba TaxID=2804194 RepID=A0A8K0VEF1_9RHOB|nr:glycoside hydrolase TIM-barrel-like domain-containing protein [Szabonella alba]MBL4918290.1 glycoside hydrolase/phage tail family protein [Szabonella alba]
MATLVLSAVGAAIGAGFGGTVLGLSGAVIGRAVGATLGRAIDQRLLGAGSEAVEVGRIDRFRLTGASEGAEIARVFGRARIAGQIIWATRFLESTTSSGGGKGAPKPRVTTYSYTVSFAIALCAGQILGVGRIWADGQEIDPGTLNLRLYPGSEDQLPDPRIKAVEGTEEAPAYRGIAYVVIEDLDIGRFGNRVPQLSFEVIRPAQGPLADAETRLDQAVRAVAMMPGSGEYTLATTPVRYSDGPGLVRPVNTNTLTEQTDFELALDNLRRELPQVGAVSLIVSWFGSNLKCAECRIEPKVDQKIEDPAMMPWRAGGLTRETAAEVQPIEGRPAYGGTPSDRSVIESIAAMREQGLEVMVYPFILMDQIPGNGLGDPWTGAEDQPVLPWRGRITTSAAPGRDGSPDGTLAAEAEVAAFFGTADLADFTFTGDTVAYSGGDGWTYRRFILHYAHLCAAAGGVDAFCIGSEMRSLTQIRGPEHSFPAVAALRALAADVRAVLGPETDITYAADWSEYFGYHADGNVYFHLDPLWSDPEIDFIGIDNYMPLSDWRDGETHRDAPWGAVHDLAYLRANILGGEGYDWYYDSPEGEAAQRRLPITDGAHDEPWIFRYKDLPGWWSHEHFNRIDGVRAEAPTAWVPGSKPIRFTEYGCAAIDKGTNQPNRFLDPKSSESGLPKYSNGRRDDAMQMHYLRAMADFWSDPANNPQSDLYAGPMLDMARAFVWAWDARPYPAFPGRGELWSDAANHARGHWLTGRATNQPLSAVIAELCEAAGLRHLDLRGLYGVVRGFTPSGAGTARAALQSLVLAFGLDVIEREGRLIFRHRSAARPHHLLPERLAQSDEIGGAVETIRAAEAEGAGRIRLGHIDEGGDFLPREVEVSFPDADGAAVAGSELPLALTGSEARGIAERWLAEARVARDTARFALPPSAAGIGAGDTVQIGADRFRIDRLDQSGPALVEAVRVEPALYAPGEDSTERLQSQAFVPPVPVFPLFLDLPLLRGNELPHAPYVAALSVPWPGAVGVWKGITAESFDFNLLLPLAATIGVTETPLVAAPSGRWDRGAPLRVRLSSGALQSVDDAALLAGANIAMIGDGSSANWEVFQFAQADLIGPRSYDLGRRLRGQLGSDALMPEIWPAGSYVVLFNAALAQLDLAPSERGLARHYRIGTAARGVDDRNAVQRVEAFSGIGLRCYSPVHLRHRLLPDGAMRASWIRRTRIDGDSWDAIEVPLAEERESYLLRVLVDGAIRREVTTPEPHWTYSLSDRLADGITAGFELHVAQISDSFGPGAFARLSVPA